MITTLFRLALNVSKTRSILVYGHGFLNSFWGIILPGASGSFSVFFMRQFFLTLPSDMMDRSTSTRTAHPRGQSRSATRQEPAILPAMYRSTAQSRPRISSCRAQAAGEPGAR
ncbi:hypothetical protein ACLBWT_02680 [Paenibacillus sp. D51F]